MAIGGVYQPICHLQQLRRSVQQGDEFGGVLGFCTQDATLYIVHAQSNDGAMRIYVCNSRRQFQRHVPSFCRAMASRAIFFWP